MATVFTNRPQPHTNTPSPTPRSDVGVLSDWITVCTAPETADNGGSTVVNPAAVTRAAQNRLRTLGLGKKLQIRLKYNGDADTPISPVVNPFGFDGNGLPTALRDATGTHEQTLTVDASTDTVHGSYKYSEPVEVLLVGDVEVLVAVKTAYSLSSGTTNDSEIQARVIS